MLEIRTATDSDAALVASLIAESFLKQAEILAISRLEYPNYVAFDTEAGVRNRIAAGVHVALGYRGKQTVGTVSCRVRSDRRCEIMRLAVPPSHRGSGYGRELMTHAEAHLVSVGAEVAELSIVARFHRLRSYYEALGYSAVDQRRVLTLPFELLFMQKVLPGALGP